MSQANSPNKVFRAGAVSAAIWERETAQEGRPTVSYSIRIQKRFKDKESDEWKNTDYLFPEDLPRVELVVREAYRYVALTEKEQNSDVAA